MGNATCSCDQPEIAPLAASSQALDPDSDEALLRELDRILDGDDDRAPLAADVARLVVCVKCGQVSPAH